MADRPGRSRGSGPEPERDPDLERLLGGLAPPGDDPERAWNRVAPRLEPARRRRRLALVASGLGVGAAAAVVSIVLVSRAADEGGPVVTRSVPPAASTPTPGWTADPTTAPIAVAPTIGATSPTTGVTADPATSASWPTTTPACTLTGETSWGSETTVTSGDHRYGSDGGYGG